MGNQKDYPSFIPNYYHRKANLFATFVRDKQRDRQQ
jgi:hypothetical protein